MLQLGTLQADISADTSGLLAAENQVTTSTKKINTQLSRTEKAAGNTGNSFKLVGRNAGQAGIQIQQFVGQIQGGQNAFVALSQQAADLGFVLGAPLVGVVVSLAAVVGGVLWDALGKSGEAMERAEMSASDLNLEYLKLTNQTDALKAAKLDLSMVENAEAMKVAEENLAELNKKLAVNEKMSRRGRSGRSGEKSEAVQQLESDIAEREFALDRMKKIQKEMNHQRGIALTESVDGKDKDPTTGTDSFDQSTQKEIAALELKAKLYGDTNAKIEAEIMRYQLAAMSLFEEGSDEFINAEQALADKRIELHAKTEEQIARQSEIAENRKNAARKKAFNEEISGLTTADETMNQLSRTRLGKNKKFAAVQAGISMAINIAKAAEYGFPQNLPFIAGAIAQGAQIKEALSGGEAFENGGIVGGTSFSGDKIPARVNSGEMILNKGQQSKLFNMANGGWQGSKQANVTIISNGTPQTVTGTQIGRDEIAIMINDATMNAEKRINGSLATGRGASAQALNKGFKVERNLR